MYSKFSIQQKILIGIFIAVLGWTVFMFSTSSPAMKHNQSIENMDSLKSKSKKKHNTLIREIHYGYVNLDSIKTLTKQLPEFNNSKRISTSRIKDRATIDIKGYEYQFFGKDDGKQWRNAYKEEFEKAGISYDEKDGLLTMKYDKGCVLIPYQILMQLTLVVDRNNKDNGVKKYDRGL